MNIEVVRDFLLWSTVINYVVLFVWFMVFVSFHNALYKLHARWFHITMPQFDALHYAGMTLYKVGILLLNLVPYIVLTLVMKPGG